MDPEYSVISIQNEDNAATQGAGNDREIYFTALDTVGTQAEQPLAMKQKEWIVRFASPLDLMARARRGAEREMLNGGVEPVPAAGSREFDTYWGFRKQHTIWKAFRQSPFSSEEIRHLVTYEFSNAELIAFEIIHLGSVEIGPIDSILDNTEPAALWNHLVTATMTTERRYDPIWARIVQAGRWHADDQSPNGIWW